MKNTLAHLIQDENHLVSYDENLRLFYVSNLTETGLQSSENFSLEKYILLHDIKGIKISNEVTHFYFCFTRETPYLIFALLGVAYVKV